MALIIDADVIIGGERRQFDLPTWLENQAENDPQIAAITIAELWHGVQRATETHGPRREAYLKMIVEGLPILPYTDTTALEHARLWAEMESSGKMIGYYDLIVAATALQHGGAVATFNERHFAQVPGLKVIKPA
ncbi:MAG: PIN domain-containing protein [Candidatus Sulfotelmatobacter sp.]